MLPIEPTAAAPADLRHYLRVVWRRKWWLVAFVAAVSGLVYAKSSSETPLYRASGQMLMRARVSETLFAQGNPGFYYNPTAIQTEIQVLQSGPVVAEVVDELPTAAGVSARQVGQTDIVEVSSVSTDPKLAADTVNAYAQAYIEVRQRQAVDDLATAVDKIQEKVADLQRDITPIDQRLAQIGTRNETEAETLRADRERLLQQQELFRSQLNQLQLDRELKTGGAQIIRPASAPGAPFSPTPVNDALTALAMALVLGLAGVFVLDHFDDRIRSKEEMDRAAAGVPVIGVIPEIRGWRRKGSAHLITREDPSSPAAEAYRTLRTSIQFIGLDRPLRTLQVTSPSASEGKTTTLANLAVVLARAGHRVIVVCCDLRRPRIHEFFGLDNSVGFTSALVGDVSPGEALQRVPGEERLFLLASGPPPPNPAELLTSRRTAELLTALQASADIVLIDCPPILPVTDAAVLSARVDGTLVVATARSTTKKELARALELLRQVDAPLVGAVLNGVKGDLSYGYGYGYRKYYGPREEPKRPKRPVTERAVEPRPSR